MTLKPAASPSESSIFAVPLTPIQSKILKILASNRDPESFVAGSRPLNRDSARFSSDIDVFHDREERIAQAATLDSQTLTKQGFTLEWIRRESGIYSVVVRSGDLSTRLEWVADSDFRFFPVIEDEMFGFMLHPVDLATNKVAAAYGRREPRDIVDLITIHERILPLGAAIWASAGKALGFTPEGIINEIRRVARYTRADFDRVASEPPVDPEQTMIRLRLYLQQAEAFVLQMPTDQVGLLFVEDGKVVQPDPTRLHDYQTHAGQRRGHWPSNVEISSAMLSRNV